MANEKVTKLDTALQDGLLLHYLMMAACSDVNVEARIEKEPFFLMLKDDGTAQHNIRDKPSSGGV
jgi:hypothetical protein